MGLSHAERVLFGGFSAGGLASAVHADAVRARLRRVRQFGVLAASGFFWPGAGADAHRRAAGARGPFLQRLYDFAPQRRLAASRELLDAARQPPGAPWRCLYASVAIAAVRAPIFVAQSARVAARQRVERGPRVRRRPPDATPCAASRTLGRCDDSPRRPRARGERRLRHLVLAALARAARAARRLVARSAAWRSASRHPLVGSSAPARARRSSARPRPPPAALRDAPANGARARAVVRASASAGARPTAMDAPPPSRRAFLSRSLSAGAFSAPRRNCAASTAAARWRWPVPQPRAAVARVPRDGSAATPLTKRQRAPAPERPARDDAARRELRAVELADGRAPTGVRDAARASRRGLARRGAARAAAGCARAEFARARALGQPIAPRSKNFAHAPTSRSVGAAQPQAAMRRGRDLRAGVVPARRPRVAVPIASALAAAGEPPAAAAAARRRGPGRMRAALAVSPLDAQRQRASSPAVAHSRRRGAAWQSAPTFARGGGGAPRRAHASANAAGERAQSGGARASTRCRVARAAVAMAACAAAIRRLGPAVERFARPGQAHGTSKRARARVAAAAAARAARARWAAAARHSRRQPALALSAARAARGRAAARVFSNTARTRQWRAGRPRSPSAAEASRDGRRGRAPRACDERGARAGRRQRAAKCGRRALAHGAKRPAPRRAAQPPVPSCARGRVGSPRVAACRPARRAALLVAAHARAAHAAVRWSERAVTPPSVFASRPRAEGAARARPPPARAVDRVRRRAGAADVGGAGASSAARARLAGAVRRARRRRTPTPSAPAGRRRGWRASRRRARS